MKHASNRAEFAAGLAAAFAVALGPASAVELRDAHQLDIRTLNRQSGLIARKLGPAASPGQRHAVLLPLPRVTALRTLRVEKDRRGNKHFRYEQTYLDVPVFAQDINVTEGPDGTLTSAFGNLVGGIKADIPSVVPALSPVQAKKVARAAGLEGKPQGMRIENESIRLMIFVDRHRRARLAYVATFFADSLHGKASLPTVVVDANSGEVIEKSDRL